MSVHVPAPGFANKADLVQHLVEIASHGNVTYRLAPFAVSAQETRCAKTEIASHSIGTGVSASEIGQI